MDLEKKVIKLDLPVCIWHKSPSITIGNPMYTHCYKLCLGNNGDCSKYQPKEIESKFKPKFKFMTDKYEV